MRILINALSARVGGGQTYLKNLLRHLPGGNEIEIFIYAPDSLELPEDYRITRLNPGWKTDNPLIRAVWEKLILPKKLKEIRPDVLFCPGGLLNTPPPDGCRTVTMFRNMVPFDSKIKKQMPYGLQRIRVFLLERIMLKSMAAADLVIFISDYARSVIENRIVVKKAVTIPHGISENFRTPDLQAESEKISTDGGYILYVSRFESYKHHYEVVSAYNELPSFIKDKINLLLVGENDNILGEKVKDLIARKGLESKVQMLGGVKYRLLPNVYRQAELIVFASSCENCPNILLEALAAGRPIICSSIMPMPEFGGDAVAYFDPSNVNEISERMKEMLTDKDLSDKLASRAAVQSEKYNWENTAAMTWKSIFSI